jgi:hypothetical protein
MHGYTKGKCNEIVVDPTFESATFFVVRTVREPSIPCGVHPKNCGLLHKVCGLGYTFSFYNGFMFNIYESILRRAGLIRAHYVDAATVSYFSLRDHIAENINEEIERLLKGDEKI